MSKYFERHRVCEEDICYPDNYITTPSALICGCGLICTSIALHYGYGSETSLPDLFNTVCSLLIIVITIRIVQLAIRQQWIYLLIVFLLAYIPFLTTNLCALFMRTDDLCYGTLILDVIVFSVLFLVHLYERTQLG